MTPNTSKNHVDTRILNGNLGTDTDVWFLVNGNIPNHQMIITGQDERAALAIMDAEGRAGAFPSVTVLGHFLPEARDAGGLARFSVSRCVSHRAIAERAFALFESATGGSSDDNWLRAERELLGL